MFVTPNQALSPLTSANRIADYLGNAMSTLIDKVSSFAKKCWREITQDKTISEPAKALPSRNISNFQNNISIPELTERQNQCREDHERALDDFYTSIKYDSPLKQRHDQLVDELEQELMKLNKQTENGCHGAAAQISIGIDGARQRLHEVQTALKTEIEASTGETLNPPQSDEYQFLQECELVAQKVKEKAAHLRHKGNYSKSWNAYAEEIIRTNTKGCPNHVRLNLQALNEKMRIQQGAP